MYMHALSQQLDHELERFTAEHGGIETLFIGGGTPSTVAPDLYAPLFEKLRPYLADDAEITSEANPNSATQAWLQGMYDLGVNRISFGVQSFDDAKLKLLARAHRSGEAVDAVHAASHVGFEHLSIDLIYATTLDTFALLEHDLEQAFALPIDHLSAYALTIEEGTPLARRPESAREQLEQTAWLFERIKAHGFSQYEISNFGTYRSRHNMGYWHYNDYIGLGSGAVGFLKDRRFYPNTSVEGYIDDPLFITTETLDAEAIRTERIFLGLRSCIGLDPALLTPSEAARAALLNEERKLLLKNGHYYNSDYLLSDELALFIQQ
jgi:oxygen-independent coproporphyrinogen-3 oxidase